MKKSVNKHGKVCVATWRFSFCPSSALLLLMSTAPKSKAGVKGRLKESAAYPRPFGAAVAALVGVREAPDTEEVTDFSYEASGPDLGALDDLLRGSKKTWWRYL